MFRVERTGPDLVEIEFSGELDREEMEHALDQVVRASVGVENGKMLYRIGDFELPTLGAMRVELGRLPEMVRTLRCYDRVALLAEERWVRRFGELEGALFPGIEIEAFEPEREDEARAWLGGDPG